MTLLHVTGIVLIVVPVAFNVFFFMLGRAFEYPDILRKPTDHILQRFTQGGARLVSLWYGFAMTALLAIPMALLFPSAFPEAHPQIASASALLGVISGLVQAMGLFRWPLLVPSLAAAYQAPSATAAERGAVKVVFNALHQYVGVVVGEHLGYLFTGAWTILIAVMMAASPIYGAPMALIGVASAVGIMLGLLEPAGWKPAGLINALSYLVWSVWLIVAGIMLIAWAPV